MNKLKTYLEKKKIQEEIDSLYAKIYEQKQKLRELSPYGEGDYNMVASSISTIYLQPQRTLSDEELQLMGMGIKK